MVNGETASVLSAVTPTVSGTNAGTYISTVSGTDTNGIKAPNIISGQAPRLRLSYYDDFLYFDYAETSTLEFTVVCPTAGFTVGVFFTYTFVVSGGVHPPYTWSLVSGSFPPGLTLNSSTGVLSGTPTMAGTYPYTVRVTDSGVPPQVVEIACVLQTTDVDVTVTPGTLALILTTFAPTISLGLFLDQINGDAGVLSTTLATGPITPIQDDELIISAMTGRAGTYSVDSGFTITDQDANTNPVFFAPGLGGALAYKIQTTAATINATWTQTPNHAMAVIIASFRATGRVFTPGNHAIAVTVDGVNATTPAISTVGAGFIAIAIAEAAGSAATGPSDPPTDSEGNTWIRVGWYQGNFNNRIILYYCANPTVDASHTFTIASGVPTICVAAFNVA